MSTLTFRSVKGSPLTNTEVDDNFTALNTDKYESGDSPTFADVVHTGSITEGNDVAVSAAGTIQGDATVLTKTYSVVTTATADQGVVLVTPAAGLESKVRNDTLVNIKVYPASGHAINDETANTALDLAPGATMKLIGVSATAWLTLAEIVVYDESGNRLN